MFRVTWARERRNLEFLKWASFAPTWDTSYGSVNFSYLRTNYFEGILGHNFFLKAYTRKNCIVIEQLRCHAYLNGVSRFMGISRKRHYSVSHNSQQCMRPCFLDLKGHDQVMTLTLYPWLLCSTLLAIHLRGSREHWGNTNVRHPCQHNQKMAWALWLLFSMREEIAFFHASSGSANWFGSSGAYTFGSSISTSRN